MKVKTICPQMISVLMERTVTNLIFLIIIMNLSKLTDLLNHEEDDGDDVDEDVINFLLNLV